MKILNKNSKLSYEFCLIKPGLHETQKKPRFAHLHPLATIGTQAITAGAAAKAAESAPADVAAGPTKGSATRGAAEVTAAARAAAIAAKTGTVCKLNSKLKSL